MRTVLPLVAVVLLASCAEDRWLTKEEDAEMKVLLRATRRLCAGPVPDLE